MIKSLRTSPSSDVISVYGDSFYLRVALGPNSWIHVRRYY